MKQITFATGNQGKIEHLQTFMGSDIEIHSHKVDLDEPQILDIKEIARAKIMQAYEILRKPVIIDDTAVYIDGYNQFPGVFAKFANTQLGPQGLGKLTEPGTTGSITCIISYMGPELDEPIFFEGIEKGRWDFTQPVRPEFAHLPYDCFLYPDCFNPEDMNTLVVDRFWEWKSQYSHRAKASQKLRDYLLS